MLGADRDHRRETDRRVHRVAAADPVPEAEHVGRVDAELRDLGGVGRHRDEVLRDRALVAQRPQRPLARAARVRHRLERREGLRGHDEQRLRRVEVARRLDEVRAVDVRDEAEGHVPGGVVAKRLVGHARSEVGPADADVDDVADPLPGVAGPATVAQAGREVRHAVEHRVHLRDHVLAVDDDRLVAWRPERHVEHRAVLCHVDLLAAEHGVDAFTEPGLLSESEKERERLVGDAVLRVVEVQADALDRQALAATRVVGEELAEMDVADLGVMVAQRLPGSIRHLISSPAQPAFLRVWLLSTRHARSSFHEATKAAAPSRWSSVASAFTSTPALAKRPRTSSASPPSWGSMAPISPWSASASSVFSGMVFTEWGAASDFT